MGGGGMQEGSIRVALTAVTRATRPGEIARLLSALRRVKLIA